MPNPGNGLFVILNRGSGKQDCSALAERLTSMAREADEVCEVRLARGGRQIAAAVSEARNHEHKRVVAGGGDGTLNAVASALAGTDKEFCALPLGTFNYFAREFGIPLDVESAFRLCLKGKARPISVGELNGLLFLNNGSVGIYPKILEVREKTYRRWGRSRLVAYWSVLHALLRMRINLSAELTTASAPPVQLRTPMIFVGRNATQLAEFNLPGPECVTNDQLAAYVLPATSRTGLVGLAIRMLLGKIRERHDVKVFCATEVEVHLSGHQWTAAIDGERRTVRSPLVFRMRRNALMAVLPERGGTGQ